MAHRQYRFSEFQPPASVPVIILLDPFILLRTLHSDHPHPTSLTAAAERVFECRPVQLQVAPSCCRYCWLTRKQTVNINTLRLGWLLDLRLSLVWGLSL